MLDPHRQRKFQLSPALTWGLSLVHVCQSRCCCLCSGPHLTHSVKSLSAGTWPGSMILDPRLIRSLRILRQVLAAHFQSSRPGQAFDDARVILHYLSAGVPLGPWGCVHPRAAGVSSCNQNPVQGEDRRFLLFQRYTCCIGDLAMSGLHETTVCVGYLVISFF